MEPEQDKNGTIVTEIVDIVQPLTSEIEFKETSKIQSEVVTSPFELSTKSLVSLDMYEKFGNGLCCHHSPPTYRCCVTNSWWSHKAFGYEWVKPSHLVKSYCFSSNVVLVTRLVISLYVTAVQIAGTCLNFDDGYFVFYFTNLSYIGLVCYFWVCSQMMISL